MFPAVSCYESLFSQAPDSENVVRSLVLGHPDIKKFPLINKYVHGDFANINKNTLGIDFLIKTFSFENARLILQLWDCSGTVVFDSMRDQLYKNAGLVYLVCEASRRETLDCLPAIIADVPKSVPAGHPLTFVLLVNDSQKDSANCLTNEELDQFSGEHNIANWYKIDVENNKGMDQAFTGGLRHYLASRYPQVKISLLEEPVDAPKSHNCVIA